MIAASMLFLYNIFDIDKYGSEIREVIKCSDLDEAGSKFFIELNRRYI